MPNVITTIVPTTEVEAVNAMLGAIGEAPLPLSSDLSSLSATDDNVNMAVNILMQSTREVLAAGWRFNWLYGFQLAPVGTYAWVDTDGVTTTLNIFKKPADCLRWRTNLDVLMSQVDLIERRSLKYTEGSPPKPVMVFFDRIRNRDGVDSAIYPHIFIDYVFSVDFADMPEPARRYAAVVASRRMAQKAVGSAEEAGFTQADEAAALRVLKREEGTPEKINLFDTADAFELNGRRWSVGGGGWNQKTYPGGA